jgi:hypothetical protein
MLRISLNHGRSRSEGREQARSAPGICAISKRGPAPAESAGSICSWNLRDFEAGARPRGERRFDLFLEPARFRSGGLRTFSRPKTLLNYTYAVNGGEIPRIPKPGPKPLFIFRGRG